MFSIVIAALPLSRHIFGLDIITLQLGRVFMTIFFNLRKSSRIILNVLEAASLNEHVG